MAWLVHLAEDAAFEKQPKDHRNSEPGKCCQSEDCAAGEPRQEEPAGDCKSHQTDAANGRACRVDAGDDAPSVGSIYTDSGLVLPFVRIDHAGTGREDRGEGQEQSADARAKAFGDQARCHAHEASEDKTYGILVQPNAPERCEFCLNDHVLLMLKPFVSIAKSKTKAQTTRRTKPAAGQW
jgi:hypothetical protein